MSPDQQTRLNFQITEAAERRLLAYCDLSGRSASGVVRQLVWEFVEGSRGLSGEVETLNGRRTNCLLPSAVLERLDARTREMGVTKGQAISNLLERWTPDSADAAATLREVVQALRRGETAREVLRRAEAFLGEERRDG